MAKRIQSTFTFTKLEAANCFATWLHNNDTDRDYGYPKIIDLRQVGKSEWTVEYSAESEFVRGMAAGIDLASRK